MIGNIKFKNHDARKKQTKQIIARTQKINKVIETGNYNTLFNSSGATRQFNNMMNDPKMRESFSDRELQYLQENFKLLTPFEKEVFVRNRLTELRDKYLVFADGTDEIDMSKLYNGILYSMQNLALENRGVSLIDMVWENRRKQ